MNNDTINQFNTKEPKPEIPDTINLLLTQMAHELATQDDKNTKSVLTNLSKKLDRLTVDEVEYLVNGMNEIYKTSKDNKNTLDNKNTNTKFISFLLKLFS